MPSLRFSVPGLGVLFHLFAEEHTCRMLLYCVMDIFHRLLTTIRLGVEAVSEQKP